MFLLEFQFLVISLDHWRRGVTLTLLTSHAQPNVLRFGDAWGVKVGKRGKRISVTRNHSDDSNTVKHLVPWKPEQHACKIQAGKGLASD